MFQRGHDLNLAHEHSYIPLVTKDGANASVIDGIDDGINAQRGVYSGDADTLRKCAEGGDHPFRTGVFENGQSAGSVELIQGGLGRTGDQSRGTEGGSELKCGVVDLFVSSKGNGSEFFNFGSVHA